MHVPLVVNLLLQRGCKNRSRASLPQAGCLKVTFDVPQRRQLPYLSHAVAVKQETWEWGCAERKIRPAPVELFKNAAHQSDGQEALLPKFSPMFSPTSLSFFLPERLSLLWFSFRFNSHIKGSNTRNVKSISDNVFREPGWLALSL